MSEARDVNVTLTFKTPNTDGGSMPPGEETIDLFTDSPLSGDTGRNDFSLCLDQEFQDRIQSFQIQIYGDDEWLPSKFIIEVEECFMKTSFLENEMKLF
eukprot:TRINITY_DN1424_c0_g1_i2.p1 TRINITY_DN1424_c0_g1~~TRINITY_DN1424_c0_g1_i2.p1  ORF type:complete len:99 (-),score=23.20 TRINITY_DN1424_c0_g1_i2:48-344(-)